MILVTGAAGYIGSHFVKYCLKNSRQTILAIDSLATGHRQALPQTERVVFFRTDIGNKKRIREILQDVSISGVVHFAGSIYPRQSQSEPFEYYENNTFASLRFFEVLEEFGIKKIVYSSSCAVYGQPQYLPINEEHPTRPGSVYGISKSMVEQILESLAEIKSWSVVLLRYFNAGGASFDGSIGESHKTEAHLIPRILDVAQGKSKVIEIYGNNWDTRDGTAIRDYVHVDDLAAAHIAALDFLNKKKSGSHVFNLGTAKDCTVLEMIRECEKATGRPIAIKIVDRQAGDVSGAVADNKKAAEQLHWLPKHDLSEIISSAWQWHKCPRY